MPIPFKTWQSLERQAWNELSDEGDLGEIRFKQRVRALAEAKGYSSEDIQTTFKLDAARGEKVRKAGYTAAHPAPDTFEAW